MQTTKVPLKTTASMTMTTAVSSASSTPAANASETPLKSQGASSADIVFVIDSTSFGGDVTAKRQMNQCVAQVLPSYQQQIGSSQTQNQQKTNHVSTVYLYGVSIVSLYIERQERLCLAQISNTLLKQFSYNEIHNRRVALGITCVQCTPVQLEILRRAGAMPVSSRRCGMITRREAERLCKSFLGDNAPPRLPDDFAFSVAHKCAWGCRGAFLPARYNSSRAKCIKCTYCNLFFSPNKFIFHSHRLSAADKYVQPDAANFNSWRRHLLLAGQPCEEIVHAWEDVKAMFNGGTRKRTHSNTGYSNSSGLSRFSATAANASVQLSSKNNNNNSKGHNTSTDAAEQQREQQHCLPAATPLPPLPMTPLEQQQRAATIPVNLAPGSTGGTALKPTAMHPLPLQQQQQSSPIADFMPPGFMMDYMWQQPYQQLSQQQQQTKTLLNFSHSAVDESGSPNLDALTLHYQQQQQSQAPAYTLTRNSAFKPVLPPRCNSSSAGAAATALGSSTLLYAAKVPPPATNAIQAQTKATNLVPSVSATFAAKVKEYQSSDDEDDVENVEMNSCDRNNNCNNSKVPLVNDGSNQSDEIDAIDVDVVDIDVISDANARKNCHEVNVSDDSSNHIADDDTDELVDIETEDETHIIYELLTQQKNKQFNESNATPATTANPIARQFLATTRPQSKRRRKSSTSYNSNSDNNEDCSNNIDSANIDNDEIVDVDNVACYANVDAYGGSLRRPTPFVVPPTPPIATPHLQSTAVLIQHQRQDPFTVCQALINGIDMVAAANDDAAIEDDCKPQLTVSTSTSAAAAETTVTTYKLPAAKARISLCSSIFSPNPYQIGPTPSVCASEDQSGGNQLSLSHVKAVNLTAMSTTTAAKTVTAMPDSSFKLATRKSIDAFRRKHKNTKWYQGQKPRAAFHIESQDTSAVKELGEEPKEGRHQKKDSPRVGEPHTALSHELKHVRSKLPGATMPTSLVHHKCTTTTAALWHVTNCLQHHQNQQNEHEKSHPNMALNLEYAAATTTTLHHDEDVLLLGQTYFLNNIHADYFRTTSRENELITPSEASRLSKQRRDLALGKLQLGVTTSAAINTMNETLLNRCYATGSEAKGGDDCHYANIDVKNCLSLGRHAAAIAACGSSEPTFAARHFNTAVASDQRSSSTTQPSAEL